MSSFAGSSASYRANRAQYAEVPLQSIAEEDVVDVSMPSMQGVAEDEGTVSSSPL